MRQYVVLYGPGCDGPFHHAETVEASSPENAIDHARAVYAELGVELAPSWIAVPIRDWSAFWFTEEKRTVRKDDRPPRTVPSADPPTITTVGEYLVATGSAAEQPSFEDGV